MTQRKAPRQRVVQRFGNPFWLVFAASLWMASVANLPLWRALTQVLTAGPNAWAFEGGMLLIIAASLAGLLSLLAWRWTLKPALIALLLVAACGAYFMMTYHVVIDASMMVNALQTDAREVRDLLSGKLLAFLLVLGVAPSIVIWRWPVAYGHWMRRLWQNLALALAAVLVAGLAVFASFSPLASTMHNHHDVRYLINPLNSLYAVGALAAKPLQRNNSSVVPAGLDAHLAAAVPSARPPLLMLVLGETGRSGNFGLNGYARDTTPELARQGVATFRDAWSCGTSTAASVPCMFSGMGRVGFEARKHNAEGLLDVIQHAGMAVLWLDNQSGCKGTCDRVPSVNTSNLQHPALCPGGECYDGIMLEGLDQRIAALPAERRAKGVVLVLHQLGSHGPAYHLRSPQAYKRFMPECASNDLQNCSRAELVNAYDNSVAYTDHFLASAVDWLKTQQTAWDPAMVYVADHGESLGENNLYLHGMPYLIAPDVQKHVPWITWLSAGFEHRSAINTTCLRNDANVRVSHDNYFHSVLGLLGIRSKVYQPQLDAYAHCANLPGAVAQAAAGPQTTLLRNEPFAAPGLAVAQTAAVKALTLQQR
ncbi:MAG: phosphoethanolamine--lipid A transferase [Polaromonas sp.]|nr:phosphoethanolamine--lipid A transferase [Polaromonas sp.]